VRKFLHARRDFARVKLADANGHRLLPQAWDASVREMRHMFKKYHPVIFLI